MSESKANMRESIKKTPKNFESFSVVQKVHDLPKLKLPQIQNKHLSDFKFDIE